MKDYLQKAGFVDIQIIDKENSDDIIKGWNMEKGVEKAVFSAYIKARRPVFLNIEA